MKKIILIIPVTLSFLLKGQDFAVTMKADTVHGKVSILSYDVIDRIQVVDGKKKSQFTAVQVRSVQLGKDQFRTVLGDNGYRMMKLVQEGTLSLYLARTKNGFYYDTYFLVKKDGESMEVPNLAFKKMMIGFLQDCASIKEKIDKGELGRKDIEKIITEYNVCIDDQTREMISKKPVSTSDPRILALVSLREKLEKSSVSGQKDMLDILKDITDKVKKDETVPNYLLENLKGGLKDVPELQPELENVLTTLKGKQ